MWSGHPHPTDVEEPRVGSGGLWAKPGSGIYHVCPHPTRENPTARKSGKYRTSKEGTMNFFGQLALFFCHRQPT